MKTMQLFLVVTFLCAAVTSAPQGMKEADEEGQPPAPLRPTGFKLPPYYQNLGMTIDEPPPTPPLQFFEPELQLDLGNFNLKFLLGLFETIGSLIPSIEFEFGFNNPGPGYEYDYEADY